MKDSEKIAELEAKTGQLYNDKITAEARVIELERHAEEMAATIASYEESLEVARAGMEKAIADRHEAMALADRTKGLLENREKQIERLTEELREARTESRQWMQEYENLRRQSQASENLQKQVLHEVKTALLHAVEAAARGAGSE